MITAHQLHVMVGARTLIEDVSFRIAPGDKVGLVGRNGAGKTTMTRILAGEGQPTSGTVTRVGGVGYLPQDPRTGDLDVLARDRILSARGIDDVVRRLRVAEDADGQRQPGRPREGHASLHRGRRRAALRRWLRRGVRGGPDQRQPRAAEPGARPAPRHPLRRPAPPRRAGPDPVLRRGDPAARRADQPPRRRLGQLAARLPQVEARRAGGDQPRCRPARRDRQPGVPPRRQPGRGRHLQRRLVDVPQAARDRRTPAQARARQRREEGEHALRPGRQDARQGDQGGGGAEHGAARRAAPRGARGRATAGQGGPTGVPDAGSVRQDPVDGQRAVEVLRLAGGLHRRRPRRSTRAAGW